MSRRKMAPIRRASAERMPNPDIIDMAGLRGQYDPNEDPNGALQPKDEESGLMQIAYNMLSNGKFVEAMFSAEATMYNNMVGASGIKSSIIGVYTAKSIEDLEKHRAIIIDYAERGGYAHSNSEVAMSEYLSSPEVLKEINRELGSDAEKVINEITELESKKMHDGEENVDKILDNIIEKPRNITLDTEEENDNMTTTPRRKISRTQRQEEEQPVTRQVRRSEERAAAKTGGIGMSKEDRKAAREAELVAMVNGLKQRAVEMLSEIEAFRTQLVAFSAKNTDIETAETVLSIAGAVAKFDEPIGDIFELLGLNEPEDDSEDLDFDDPFDGADEDE